MVQNLSLPSSIATRPAIMALCNHYSKVVGTSLLFSGGNLDSAQRSFLSLFPYESISVHGQKVCRNSIDGEVMRAPDEQNPWDSFKELIDCDRTGALYPEWTGYLGYEMGAYADPDHGFDPVEGAFPDAYFQKCAVVLVVDHEVGVATAYIEDSSVCGFDENIKDEVHKLSSIGGWLTVLAACEPKDPVRPNLRITESLEEREHYCRKIDRIKELVYSGDIYQMNLSQRCVVSGDIDTFDLFAHLVEINPAPFSAYLHLPDGVIISSSPERHLQRVGQKLETRPIKGTIPRGKEEWEDLRNKDTLLASEKDRAELMMITDLMRNDLGKISEVGSVEVTELIRCEAYTNVYHLLSVIESVAVEGLHSLDAIRACFPGGSITGCPKLRAMEVISDIEQRRRGIYTGSIGYFCGNGDFDFSIAIRTLLARNNAIEIQLGGAIVADSDPQAEYQETLDKGASIFACLGIECEV